MKKRVVCAALVSIMTMSLAACSGGAASAPAETKAESTEAKTEAAETTEKAAEAEGETKAEGGTLIVGFDQDFPPMGFMGDDGEYTGFDLELAQEAAKRLGLEYKPQPIAWDAKDMELESGNIDCIWNGMCITEERKQNMSISDPYLYNTQAMVMKKSREKEIMKSVKGLTVTAEQGSTGEGKIDGSIADDDTVKVSAQDYFKDANYVASDSMAKALMEVKSGTADVALVDSVCALGMVGEGTDYSDLVINMDNNFGQQEYGIAFRKGSDVTEKVNEAIKELYEDGTVDTIAKKYGLQEMLIK